MIELFRGTPRQVQVDALTKMAANLDHNLFVISVPTGGGKSGVAHTIGRFAEREDLTCSIVVPNKMLLDQYESDYLDLTIVKGVYEYLCTGRPGKKCGESRARKAKRSCKDSCRYDQVVAKAKLGARAMTLATYLGTRKILGYPDITVFDEAQKLIEFMRDKVGMTLWRNQHHFPPGVREHEDIVRWTESCSPNKPGYKELLRFKRILLSKTDDTVVTTGYDLYRGNLDEYLRADPVSVRNAPPILWPNKRVKTVVLLSATFGPKDVEELGLDKYFSKVCYIDCDSPIPAGRRPVYAMAEVDCSHANQAASIPEVAKRILERAAHHEGEAGLVHATYADAPRYRHHLQTPRFMWHDHDNKPQVYNQFIGAELGKARILVGSGLTEGIDLAGERATWQVLTKVPAHSLEDPLVRAKRDRDPEWYAWESVKQVLQACGRVCRGPDDVGVTYIFDRNFKTLYDTYEYMFPVWFKDSLRWQL